MIKPIPKPGLKPKKPKKALKRTAIKKTPSVTGWRASEGGRAQFVIKGKDFGPPIEVPSMIDTPGKRLFDAIKKLPKTNPERKRERHMRDFDGGIEHDHFVRTQGCALADHAVCCGSIQAAHVRPRSVGGRWHDLVGLCNLHHRLQESKGNEWIRAATGVDLVELAKQLARKNLREKGAI